MGNLRELLRALETPQFHVDHRQNDGRMDRQLIGLVELDLRSLKLLLTLGSQ